MDQYKFNQKSGFTPKEVWEEVLEDIVDNRVKELGVNPDVIRSQVCSLVAEGSLEVVCKIDDETLEWEMKPTMKGKMALALRARFFPNFKS